MKFSYLDFVYSFLCGGLLLLASWTLAFFLIGPHIIESLGGYAYIVNTIIFFTCYGLLSGFLLQALLCVRPIKSGEFDAAHAEVTYWKLLTMIHYFGQKSLFLLNVAPAMPLLARLFGAKIGSNVAIGGTLDSPFLIEIGDNCIIGASSMVSANMHVSGKTTIGTVYIGSDTTIGAYSMVLPNTKLGRRVTLAPNSIVIIGTEIPDGELWKGNPARKWQ